MAITLANERLLYLGRQTSLTHTEQSEMNIDPSLPGLYRLVRLDRVDSVEAELIRLAGMGAEEGTVVWAERQTGSRGSGVMAEPGPEGNLFCAILMRPDFPLATAMEINFVAAVSLGAALAGAVSPLSMLQYRWPNEILVNAQSVAVVSLSAPTAKQDPPEWLSVSALAQIAAAPERSHAPTGCIAAVDGASEVAVGDLLEQYTRQFLVSLNRWAERGLDAVLTGWRQRLAGIDTLTEVPLGADIARGRLTRVDPDGSAVLVAADAAERRVTLGEYYAAFGEPPV